MEGKSLRRWLVPVMVFAGLWVAVRYFLPIALPFILGTLVALAAEPGIRFLQERCRIPRGLAVFVVISLGFVMLLASIWLLGAVVYRELTVVASGLPGMVQGLTDGVERIRLWAVDLADRAPEGLRSSLVQWVGSLFAGGSVFLEQAASGFLGMAGSVMGGIPGGAMLIGTAVISSFMISAQLPALRSKLKQVVKKQWLQTWILAFSRVKEAVGGWLKAQVKLSGVTFCIVGIGFLLLRIRNPVFWAVLVALVDAVPLLGTGTILIPWTVIALIQGDGVRALGLAGIYVTAMLIRSGLEPKLVGRQLGMNPLLTLMALYAGYRIWGVSGMILAPILTVTAKQLVSIRE